MNVNKKVIILHNSINIKSTPDEADVLKQVELVYNALKELDYNPETFSLNENLNDNIQQIIYKKPLFVFNLVESIFGKGELLYFAPALLNAFHIPFTGISVESLFLTTNKILAKKILKTQNIPTPEHFTIKRTDLLEINKKYILKPICEDGSVGLNEVSVFSPTQKDIVDKIKHFPSSHYFIEEYIDGREFNISILGGKSNYQIFEPAEIIFKDFQDDKAKILDYKAKWDETSLEYKNTIRTFNTLDLGSDLYKSIIDISRQCWKIFDLTGYARIDFRIDKSGQPYVIEINGNPCISYDSGFMAAAYKSGLSDKDVIKKIINEVI